VIDENEVKDYVHYADHYYSADKNYLQMCSDIRIQTYDDCMISPNEDSAHDEMKDEPKLMLRMNFKDKQLNMYYN
jgi:hypothetical protein